MSFGIDTRQIVRSDRWTRRSVPLSQRRGDLYVVPHHSVTFTRQQTIDTFNSSNRFVSANLAIGPDVAQKDDYHTTETVDIDTGRAATTSSSIDDQAITFEMCNIAMGGDYPVGATGKEKFVQVLVDAHKIFGMPLVRARVLSHRDVYAAGWGSYPTACPGDDLERFIPTAIDLAIRRVNNSQEDDMSLEDLAVDYNKTGGEKVPAGKTIYLHIDDKGSISVAIGAAKMIAGNLHIAVEGGQAYQSSFKVWPVVNTVDKNLKIVSSVSLGAQEVVFTDGGTTGKIPVNCALQAGQRLAFKVGGYSKDFKVIDAIFRGTKGN